MLLPRMRPHSLPVPVCLALGALTLLAGCSGLGSDVPVPAAPVRTIPMPAYVQAVRRAIRGQDGAEAQRLLAADHPLDVAQPERTWLLVRLASSRCRSHIIRAQTWRLPRGDLGDAMRALAAEEPERALGRLGQARGGPDRWRELATGHLLAQVGDPAAALRAATRALASRRDLVRHEAWLLRGRLLLGEGDLDGAHAAADEAARLDATDARPPRLHASAAKAAGRIDDAALYLLAALRIAPESPRYAHRLAETLRLGAAPATWARVDQALAPLAQAAPANAELIALRALGADHAGRARDAERYYRAALAAGATPVPLDRDLRRVLMRRGAWGEAITWLMRAVPPDVLDDPHNLLRGNWAALAQAAAAASGPGAPDAARRALGRSLVGVGALDEALPVLDTLDDAAARGLARRVRGHLAFEAGLRAWIEAGYNTAKRKEEPPTFESGLLVMQRLAREHLQPAERSAFAEPGLGLRELPLLGSWLDHSTNSTSPVVAHFRRYGRFLLYGRQGDVPVEAIVLSLASLSASRPISSSGRSYRHDVAIGYDRALRSNIAAQGGSLGGACLSDGIWIDADTARRGDFVIRQALRSDPSFLPVALRAVAAPPHTLDGPLAQTDTGCAAARLVARYVQRRPHDPWGSYGTLVAHEFGHVADIRRHLPIVPRLPSTIALLARGGLDFDKVQMELEMRAQLGACIDAPDPDLALAEMLVALPVKQRSPEVHDGGYRDGVRAMMLYIHAHPARYPQIDVSRRILPQLDRLTNAQIRQTARAVLGR